MRNSFYAKSLEQVAGSDNPRYSRFSAVGVGGKPLVAAGGTMEVAKNSAGLHLGFSWFQ